jgi:hypothetical protein
MLFSLSSDYTPDKEKIVPAVNGFRVLADDFFILFFLVNVNKKTGNCCYRFTIFLTRFAIYHF